MFYFGITVKITIEIKDFSSGLVSNFLNFSFYILIVLKVILETCIHFILTKFYCRKIHE